LDLDEFGGETLRAVSVVEGEGSAESGGGHSEEGALGHHLAPRGLARVHGVHEELVHQQIAQLGVLVEGVLDVAEESTADDAAAAPHERDAAVVQVPAVDTRRLAHQHETLSVRHDLGRVQSLEKINFLLIKLN